MESKPTLFGKKTKKLSPPRTCTNPVPPEQPKRIGVTKQKFFASFD